MRHLQRQGAAGRRQQPRLPVGLQRDVAGEQHVRDDGGTRRWRQENTARVDGGTRPHRRSHLQILPTSTSTLPTLFSLPLLTVPLLLCFVLPTSKQHGFLLRPSSILSLIGKLVPYAESFHRLTSVAFSDDPLHPGFHLSIPSSGRV